MALLNFISFPKEQRIEVYYENGVDLGEIGMLEDGFYYYWPKLRAGCWSSHVMREIADKIDELDKPYQEQIDKYFSQHGEDILSEDPEEKTPVVVESGQKQNSEAS